MSTVLLPIGEDCPMLSYIMFGYCLSVCHLIGQTDMIQDRQEAVLSVAISNS